MNAITCNADGDYELLSALFEGKPVVTSILSFFFQEIILCRTYLYWSTDYNMGYSTRWLLLSGLSIEPSKILELVLYKPVPVLYIEHVRHTRRVHSAYTCER
jgi:hypothetical protein